MNLLNLTLKTRSWWLSLLIVLCTASSAAWAQTIKLDFKEAPLKEVLVEVTKQSGYKFIYSTDIINADSKITIKSSYYITAINKLLDSLFKDKNISYQIKGQQVVLTSSLNKNHNIYGSVVDEDGVPLVGVNITSKDRAALSSTDVNGKFSIEIAPGSIINFSYIGFQSISMPAVQNMNVEMKQDIVGIEELVVTGYQTISKERSAGAYEIVKGDKIKDKANTLGSVLGSLEGMATGLSVNYGSDGDKYLIRGITSINSNRTPLFVVDGVPLSSDAIEEMVNNNDVESVTFLKDATAASIWGAQAANGVIVLSTRRGVKEHPLKISYDGSFTYKGKPDYGYMDIMNSETYIKNTKEIFDPVAYPWQTVTTTKGGIVGSNPVVYPHELPLYQYSIGQISESQMNKMLEQLASQNNRQQYEKYFMSNSFFTNHTISFSGGGKYHTYYGSFNYKGTKGINKDTDNKYALNIRQTLDFTKWLRLDLTLNASVVNSKAKVMPSQMSSFPYTLYKNSQGVNISLIDELLYSDVYKNAEDISKINLDFYPVSDFNNSFNKTYGINLRANAGITIQFVEGFKYEGRFQFYNSTDKTEKYLDADNFYVRLERVKATNGSGEQYLPSKGGHFTKSDSHSIDWTVRNQLTYDKRWNSNKHQLSALAGMEIRDNTSSSFSNFVRGYDYQTMTYELYDMELLNSTGVANPLILNSSSNKNVFASQYFDEDEVKYRFVSYYGNTSYTLNNKYVFNGSIRVDQSNLFGTSTRNQFKPIWSTGFAWHIGEEKILKSYKGLSRLTLRLSYGLNGNSPDPGMGGPYDIITPMSSSLYPSIGYTIITPANDKLTWERTNVWNVGVDYGFLNNRISGSIDVYSKYTKDLFGQVLQNSVSGWFSSLGNLGNMTNKGVELLINSQNIKGRSFSWNTDFTLTYNKNKVTKLEVDIPYTAANIVGQSYIEGYSANCLFAYKWAGLNEKGAPQAYASDGSKVTRAINLKDLNSMRYMGTITPPWYGSLSNTLKYKNLELSFMFVYYLGHKMRNDVNTFYYERMQGSIHKDFDDRWRAPGDENSTNVPAYTSVKDTGRDFSLYYYADINVLNASYAKLRDISLTYNLPKNICDKLKCDNIKVSLSAGNLFTITANKEGIDPEAYYLKSGVRADRYKPSCSATVSINF